VAGDEPPRQRNKPHPLGPRPDANDPIIAAVRRANLGARLEIERCRRVRHRPVDRIEELEREVEWLRGELFAIWTGLPF
jgi:hypothetical protein